MIDIADEIEDILEMDINEKRARQSIVYEKCLNFSTSKFFTGFISFSIFANTVVLGLDEYPEDVEMTKKTDTLNMIFYWIFFMEMIIRQTATGFKMYFKDHYNTFDCVVVFVSTLDLAVNVLVDSDTSEIGAI